MAGPTAPDERDDQLAVLLRDRGAALRGHACLLTGNAARAEDLLQDALVSVLARSRGGAQIRVLEAYVRTAMARRHVDAVRRRGRWSRVVHLLAAREAEQPAGAAEVDSEVDLADALRGLSARQRACLVLRFYDDLGVRETARTLGLSESAVKKHTQQGLRALREVIGGTVDADQHGGVPILTEEKP